MCYYEGQDGVLRVDVFLQKFAKNSIQSFSSMVMAKDHLYKLVENTKLCPKYTGLERTKETCYLGSACALCSGTETMEEYNQKVMAATQTSQNKRNVYIVGPGRTREEKSVVRLVDGDYTGFGFVAEDLSMSQEDLHDCIKPFKNNNDIKRIVNGFFAQPIPKVFRLIKIEEFL